MCCCAHSQHCRELIACVALLVVLVVVVVCAGVTIDKPLRTAAVPLTWNHDTLPRLTTVGMHIASWACTTRLCRVRAANMDGKEAAKEGQMKDRNWGRC